MRYVLAAVAAALAFGAAPAIAFDGHVKQCYTQHYQEPEYTVTRHLVRDAFTRIEYRGAHRAEKVYYPPVYEERRTLTRKGHYVLRPAPCPR